MNAQRTRKLVEEARAALADGADGAASGSPRFFSTRSQSDKDFVARENIRLEIVRTVFDVEPDVAESSEPAFACKIAKLLRLS